jgi:hypothetical protein
VESSDVSAKSFTRPAYSKGEERVLIMKKTLWKDDFNFVKDVTIIDVNFIITEITVSVKKKLGGITFVPLLLSFWLCSSKLLRIFWFYLLLQNSRFWHCFAVSPKLRAVMYL